MHFRAIARNGIAIGNPNRKHLKQSIPCVLQCSVQCSDQEIVCFSGDDVKEKYGFNVHRRIHVHYDISIQLVF